MEVLFGSFRKSVSLDPPVENARLKKRLLCGKSEDLLEDVTLGREQSAEKAGINCLFLSLHFHCHAAKGSNCLAKY
jgi:hypothetical protein